MARRALGEKRAAGLAPLSPSAFSISTLFLVASRPLIGAITDWFIGPVLHKLLNACSDNLQDQYGWQTRWDQELERLRENHPKIQAVVFADLSHICNRLLLLCNPLLLLNACSDYLLCNPLSPFFFFAAISLIRWFGLVGQFRPRKLISSIKKDLKSTEDLDLSIFKDIGKHFLDKSLYALGFFSQLSLSDDTSLLFNVEKHGERRAPHSKLLLLHKLPKHDVTLEAAWPELYVARNGTYWEVPSSASFDVSSLKSESGFRYRFGLHKNDGNPAAFNSSRGDIPLSLMPGICAKAAFSIEKRKNLWRESGEIVSQERKSEKRSARLISYDKQLKDPHAAVSAIIGGTCEAWFGGNVNKAVSSKDQTRDEEIHKSSSPPSRHHFNMDLFGSFGCSFQRGRFANDFNDLTRVDARLDVSSASALLKGFSHLVSTTFKGKVGEVNPLAFPRLNVIFQQQVAGPIVFRADVGFSVNHLPHVEDVIYGLSYSLRMLHSGKFLAWYSTKRKEGMVELRFFEF